MLGHLLDAILSPIIRYAAASLKRVKDTIEYAFMSKHYLIASTLKETVFSYGSTKNKQRFTADSGYVWLILKTSAFHA